MKRNIIILTFTTLLLIMIAGFGSVVEAQRGLPTISFTDLNSTLQVFMGTLTAISSDIQSVVSTPSPRRTSVPRATQLQSSVETIEAPLRPTLPAIALQTPSSSTTSRSERYVLFRPGEMIDIDGVVAFTITLAVGWLVILFILSMAGSLFSRLMMKGIIQSAMSGVSQLRPIERIIRSLYEGLISVLSIYFFLSLPVLVIIIAALILNLNRTVSLSVPGIIILGISAYGSFYMLRSIWVGIERLFYTPPVNLHSILSRNESSDFWQIVNEVGQRLNTSPIQTVYLTPDTNIRVYEMGGLFAQLTNRSERFMVLGVGAISGLSQHQFKAILAHEYSHFAYRDTGLGHGISVRVSEAIIDMYNALKEKHYNHLFNPIWLFVILFARVFLPITASSRRYGEIFADRQAAQFYGSATFVNALIGLVHQEVVMDIKIRKEIQEAADEKRTLHNVYQLPGPDEAQQSQIVTIVNQKLNLPAHTLATHPSLQLRLAFISQMPYTGFEVDLLSKPAWDLFSNPEKIQSQMTQLIQKNLNLHQFYNSNNFSKPNAETQT